MTEGALVVMERKGWRGRQRERGRGETEVEQHLCDVPRTVLSDPRNLRRVNECCVQHATQTLSWFALELICWLAPLLVMWPGDLSCCSSKWNLVGGPVKVPETKVGGGRSLHEWYEIPDTAVSDAENSFLFEYICTSGRNTFSNSASMF